MRRVRGASSYKQITPLNTVYYEWIAFEKVNQGLRLPKRAFACNFMGGQVLDRLWRR
jgi:hypothetical protein